MSQKTTKNVEFDRKLQELEMKQGKFTADRVISDNKVKEKKKKVLSDLFGKMKDAGVDFSNIESVNEFLDMIKGQDPDFLVLLENAISALTDEDGSVQDVIDDQVTLPVKPEQVVEANPNVIAPQAPQAPQASSPVQLPQQSAQPQPSQPIQLPQ